jgi:8-oxo-dGTP pyrophosphatase MutT (NUDIX family)
MKTLTEFVVPEPAATLLLVRENPELEVYMTRRHPALNFLAGHYVFPGGKRDDDDFSGQSLSRIVSKDVGQKAGQVESDEPVDKKLGYYAAAIRESFEEAGVLIACRKDGSQLEPDKGLQAELASSRQRLHKREIPFLSLMEEFGLFYDIDRLVWFAHWVTPFWSPRRFDAQFFVALLPSSQTPEPFAEEIDEALWINPGAGLEKWQTEEMKMIPPTLASLNQLSRFRTVAEIFKTPA